MMKKILCGEHFKCFFKSSINSDDKMWSGCKNNDCSCGIPCRYYYSLQRSLIWLINLVRSLINLRSDSASIPHWFSTYQQLQRFGLNFRIKPSISVKKTVEIFAWYHSYIEKNKSRLGKYCRRGLSIHSPSLAVEISSKKRMRSAGTILLLIFHSLLGMTNLAGQLTQHSRRAFDIFTITS